jgi:hypothetical protein
VRGRIKGDVEVSEWETVAVFGQRRFGGDARHPSLPVRLFPDGGSVSRGRSIGVESGALEISGRRGTLASVP